MNSTKFRKELEKIMPGYKWTVHHNRYLTASFISATGIQSAGSNRLSTVEVVRTEKNSEVEYSVRSAGFGKSAPWLSENTDGTLARALRGLQDHYEAVARSYGNHAYALKGARKKSEG